MALDFETTRTDTDTARVVEVALIGSNPDIANGEYLPLFCHIVNPGVEIPGEAAAIHGITTERAIDFGISPQGALAVIASAFVSCASIPLVIYNVPFDFPLLLAEAKRYGVEIPAWPNFLDPLLLDRHFDKYRRGSRKLEDVAKHYGVKLDGTAHGSRVDAAASIGIMRKIVGRYPELFAYSIGHMQTLQAMWYANWKKGINEYWESKGDSKRVVTDWPCQQ